MLLEKRKEELKCNGSIFIESNASLIKTIEKEVDSYCANFANGDNEMITCIKCRLIRLIERGGLNQKEKRVTIAIAGMMARAMSYEHSISPLLKTVGIADLFVRNNVGIIFEESVEWISRELDITQKEARKSLEKMLYRFY